MLQHAHRHTASPLSSILQAAASRAWMRTRPAPVRTYRRTGSANQGDVHVAQVSESSSNSFLKRAGPSRLLRPTNLSSNPQQSVRTPLEDASLARKRDDSVAGVSGGRIHDAKEIVVGGPKEESPDTLEASRPLRKSASPILPDIICGNTHVCDVRDVDTLDVDPGLAFTPPYEDDPPWRQLAASIRLPSVAVRDPYPDYTKFTPYDHASMYRILLSLVLPGAVLSLHKLERFHSTYPQYQSNATFNFLISLALQQDNIGVARHLFEQMRLCGLGNVETRQLRVRMLVRTGQWDAAWEMEAATRPLPLPIWMEFAQSEREPHLRQMLRQRKFAREGKPMEAQRATLDTLRTQLLLRNFPSMRPEQLAKMPPHMIFVVCRWMIQMNQRDTARIITTAFFKSLPTVLKPNLQRKCMDIIHLHLLPNSSKPGSDYAIAVGDLDTFLSMHEALVPNATTLFLLLRTLKRAKQRTSRALKLVRNCTELWGPAMVDHRVRRRLISIALSEKEVDIADTLMKQQQEANLTTEEDSAQWSDVLDRWTTLRKSTEKYPHRELFPQRGTEKSKMGVLFRRIRRLKLESQQKSKSTAGSEGAGKELSD